MNTVKIDNAFINEIRRLIRFNCSHELLSLIGDVIEWPIGRVLMEPKIDMIMFVQDFTNKNI